MIDNSELIKPLFYFNEGNNMFFHCQIVQRAKDYPEEKVKERSIKTYFIRSREALDKLMPEIRLLCEHYQARAYINVGGKDFDKINKLMLVKLASYNLEGNLWTINPRRVLNSCAGEIKPNRPAWIIDLDNDNIAKAEEYKIGVLEYLDKEFLVDENIPFASDRRYAYLYAEIPTVNGLHLITNSFNLNKFNLKFPNIMVHKNSMGTLLYYPNNLNK